MARADLKRNPSDKEEIAGAEAVQSFAEKAREMAEQRDSTERALAAARNIDLGFIPTDDTNDDAREAAEWLTKQKRDSENEKDRLVKQSARIYRYFVKCRETHQPGVPPHGIYFTKPIGNGEAVNDADWFSLYKKRDQPWRGPIVCQVCLKEGRETPLPVTVIDRRKGTFTVDPRWLYRRAKDPERAHVEGGEYRAVVISGEVNNEALYNSEKRWNAHLERKGQEVSRG